MMVGTTEVGSLIEVGSVIVMQIMLFYDKTVVL